MICNPISSVTCERSFNCMRRLKTWLRNSMMNERLNSVMLCIVHKEILEEIKDDELIKSMLQILTYNSPIQI